MIGTMPFHGYRFEGTRFDCGDKAGFVEATMAYALDHDTVGKPAREMLRRLAKTLD